MHRNEDFFLALPRPSSRRDDLRVLTPLPGPREVVVISETCNGRSLPRRLISMRSHSESDSGLSIHPFRLSVRTALAVLLFTVLLPSVVLADDPESQKEKERQALLEEAQEAAQTSEEEAKTRARTPGQSGQRVQSLLNPEISFLGDFSYNWSDQAIRNEFFLRSAELAMQAPLDPYTRFKTFITGEQEPTVLEFAPGGDIRVDTAISGRHFPKTGRT